jgi:flagellar L-ring protein precursor FlgH
MPCTTLIRRLALALLVATLCACSVIPPQPLVHSEGFKPVYPVVDAQPKLATGAIFNNSRSEAFFGVGRSYVVGDLVSVLLAENTSANRSQNASLKKTAGAKVSSKGLLNIFGDLGPELGSTVTNDGSGQTNQEQTLTGSVTVSVVEIMPNGNLVLRGEKQVALSEGSEIIQVSGVVRPEDIAPNNTVLSRRLANAQISYRGIGDESAATRAGWGTSGILKFMPF